MVVGSDVGGGDGGESQNRSGIMESGCGMKYGVWSMEGVREVNRKEKVTGLVPTTTNHIQPTQTGFPSRDYRYNGDEQSEKPSFEFHSFPIFERERVSCFVT